VLGMIAWVYILLCVRIRVQIEAAWVNGQGNAAFCVGALGVYLRRDFMLTMQAFSIQAQPRYGKKGKKNTPDRSRKIRIWLAEAMRSNRFEQISLYLRLGLGDACETAVATGAVRALGSTIFAAACNGKLFDWHVTPDFTKPCLCAYLRGLASWQLGDVVLAALKQMRKKRRKGLKWTGIPLRA